jgi:hypothetical protein
MLPSEITKPANKGDLVKALNQRGWKFLETREVVNREDVRNLNSHMGMLVSKGKKICVAIIERE